MNSIHNQRRGPTEQRNFVHKRLFGAAEGFFSGGPAGAVSGFVRPRSSGSREAAVAAKHGAPKALFPGSSAIPCIPPAVRDFPGGPCYLGERVGRDVRAEDFGVGEATMGRYGAGLIPGSKIVDRATCLPGMQLGNDGLCYNKGQIKNSERMWPQGRKPLLSGGDMRAISVAHRAAGRLTRTAQKLQEIGLIQKPVTRSRKKK